MLLLSVNFHYISDVEYPLGGIYPVTPAKFESQLVELGRSFEFVSLQQVLAAIEGRDNLPARSLLITFDDGLAEQYENAWPVLKRMDIPAAFFVSTSPYVEEQVASVHQLHWLRAHVPTADLLANLRQEAEVLGTKLPDIRPDDERLKQYRYDSPENAALKFALNFALERPVRETILARCFQRLHPAAEEYWAELYMSRDALRELAEAGALGTHGHRHLPLATLETKAARNELGTSLDWLAENTGRRPCAVSYPYGGADAVSREVAVAAASLGLRLGITMERALNRSLSDPLLLARCDTNDAPGGKRPLFTVEGDTVHVQPGFSSARQFWGREKEDSVREN